MQLSKPALSLPDGYFPEHVQNRAVQDCTRCRQDHAGLRFLPLKHPTAEGTHWARCPTNGEPILAVIEPATIQAAASSDEGKAFRLAGASEGLTIEAAKGDDKLPSFKGNAYTGGPMKPLGWYRELIVDLAGVKIAAQHRPVLRQHDHEQILGHTTKVSADAKGIHVEGTFSGEPAHVAKVTTPAKNGFEWQLSIGGNPVRTEFLEAGQKATVNGREITGPMTIARETAIDEISFVPLGADQDTSVSVAASANQGKTMNPFAIALKELMATLRAAGKSCKYSDEQIDKMDKDEARSALRKMMKASEEEDEDEDAEDEKKSKSAAATLKLELTKAAADFRAEMRAGIVAEELRVADIKARVAKHSIVTVEIEEAGAKKTVNLVAHAIGQNWTADQAELVALRADRPAANVGIPGGLGYSPSSPELSEAVLECAVMQETRCQVMSESFFKGKHEDRESIHAETASRIQRELRTRYPEQVQDAAWAMFKGRIGLQRLLTMCARAGGYTGREVIRDDATLGAIAAAAMRIHADGSSTINIANVVANVQNKFLLQGYMYTEQAYAELCGIRPVNDFKPTKSINLFGDIEFKALGESGELANASLQDQAFANQATTSGRIITLPRTSIINDDIGALSTVPMILGRGAGLRINKLFWTKWMNPGNDDGGSTAFYAATHTIANMQANSNYSTGAGSALSSAGLTAAVLLFDNQIDPVGNPLGVDPEIVAYPSDLETTAWELLNSEFIVYGGGTAAKQPSRNKFAGRFKPVKSKYLNKSAYTGYSTIAWYLLANPAILPVIEIAALGGVLMPTVQVAGPDFQFNILGITTRAFFDVDVNMQNFRGGIKSAGA